MADLKTYNPKQVVVAIGELLISGTDEGTFVTVERNQDAFAYHVGANGDAIRIQSNDRSGIITIRLLQSSSSNDDLSALHLEDQNFGTGTRAAMVKDTNGTSLAMSPTAWIQKVSNIAFGDGAEGREWIVACHDLDMLAGGHLV